MREIVEKISEASPARKGLLMAVVAIVMLVPWLGLTEFNTKGEPREAVVSMSMFQQDNWVLPSNNDVDIPYKPMMFHWTGAVAALANGGEVNEFTARFPSAMALALLAGATAWFYARFGRDKIAPLLTAVVMLTCFELHRSGVSARVDMTLTFWMVAAFYLLYRWWVRENDGVCRRFLYRVPWLAILCMSAATLSKGPVGIVLPLLAMGLFMLLKGRNVFTTALWMSLFAVLALIIPLWWYYSAWKQGGDNFIGLVLEENFGRMTGGMSYESHENPWHYNFWITAVGFLPWTLLAIFAAVAMTFRKIRTGKNRPLRGNETSLLGRFRWRGNDLDLFSLVSLGVVLIFFCLPSSKRSVYLMPAYPFIAWFAAKWFLWLGKRGYYGVIRGYGALIAAVAVIIECLFLAIHLLPADVEIFSGRKAAANNAMVAAIADSGILAWILVGLLFASGVIWFAWRGKSKHSTRMLGLITVMLFFMYTALDGGLQPGILNAKSLKSEAGEIARIIGDEPIYEYIEFGESATANRYHFFELDFYLQDRLKNFVRRNPSSGYLAIPESDVARLQDFSESGYTFKKVYRIDRPARKEKIEIYSFEKEN